MVLVENSVGRLRRGCENNIRMNLKEIVCEGVDWIDLNGDRDRWRALVNTGN